MVLKGLDALARFLRIGSVLVKADGSAVNVADAVAEIEASALVPRSYLALPAAGDGSLVTAADAGDVTTVEFGGESVCLFVRNRGAADILVSLDGGGSWFDLAAGQSVDLPIRASSMQVKSTAALVPFSVLVGVA